MYLYMYLHSLYICVYIYIIYNIYNICNIYIYNNLVYAFYFQMSKNIIQQRDI